MEYMIFSALSYDNATEIFERLLLMLKSFALCVCGNLQGSCLQRV